MLIQRKEVNPAVLVSDGRTEHGVEPVTYEGTLRRVVPTTARDVFALQMLEHRREKFAPAQGGGILVTATGLQKVLPPQIS